MLKPEVLLFAYKIRRLVSVNQGVRLRMAHDEAAAVVACDLVVPGVFFGAVIALVAVEVERGFDVRVDAFTKLRTAVRAGCDRSIVRLL